MFLEVAVMLFGGEMTCSVLMTVLHADLELCDLLRRTFRLYDFSLGIHLQLGFRYSCLFLNTFRTV